MIVFLVADPLVLLRRAPVALHVLARGVAEELRRGGCRCEPAERDHELELLVERVRAIGELHTERALLHLLEAEGENAFREAALDELLRHEERGGSRRAGV